HPHRDLHSFPTRRSSDLAMAANVLDVMAEYLPLVVQTRVSATTNPTTRIYSRSGAVLRENRTSEALPRCAESILDNGLDGCYDRSEEHTSELQSLRHLVC